MSLGLEFGEGGGSAAYEFYIGLLAILVQCALLNTALSPDIAIVTISTGVAFTVNCIIPAWMFSLFVPGLRCEKRHECGVHRTSCIGKNIQYRH